MMVSPIHTVGAAGGRLSFATSDRRQGVLQSCTDDGGPPGGSGCRGTWDTIGQEEELPVVGRIGRGCRGGFIGQTADEVARCYLPSLARHQRSMRASEVWCSKDQRYVKSQGVCLLRKLPTQVRATLRYYEVAASLTHFVPKPPLNPKAKSLPMNRCFYFVVTDWTLHVYTLDNNGGNKLQLELPWLAVQRVVS